MARRKGEIRALLPESDAELVEVVHGHGGVRPYARHLGIHHSSLLDELGRRGVTERVKAALEGTHAPQKADSPVSPEEVLLTENRELRKALGAQRKAVVADERLMRALEAALSNVPPVALPELVEPPKSDPTAHHRQLLLLSDFHGGEVVDPEAVNGLNAYSWEIMEQRVDEVIKALLSHKRNSPDTTGLDILFLGDMNSGSVHQELAETNQYALAEQGVRMGYLMGSIIERVAPEYPGVRVGSVVGNHPRLKIKPAAKRPHDNMDWVAALIAKEYLRGVSNVSFTVGGNVLFWQIAGLTYYTFHGDGIRSTMPGVPWGGVMRRTNEIRRSHDRRIDGFILGHYHQANAMFDLGIFMNGALKGTDEWVQKNFGGGSSPCQLLLTFDEKGQRLTDCRLITPTAGIPT